jgi:hypothetical protein
LERGRLSVGLATSTPRSTSTAQQAWNKTGKMPVPVVMARLAATPAPWGGGDELFVEEPASAAAGGEAHQAAEMGLEQPEQVQQSQAGGLPTSGFDAQSHVEKGALSRSPQKTPELAVQKPVQSAAAPVKPQEEARESERGSVEKQATAGSLSPQEDGVWKRLQTIFRKHEEKRHEAEVSADTQSNRTAEGEGVVELGEEGREKLEDGSPRSAAEAPEQAAALDAGTAALSAAGATSTPGTLESGQRDVPGAREAAGESLSESQIPRQSPLKDDLTSPEPVVVGDLPSLPRVQSLEAESVTGTTNLAVPSKPPVVDMSEAEETLFSRTDSPTTPVLTAQGDTAERSIEGIPTHESAPGDFSVKKPVEPQSREFSYQAPQIVDQKSQAIQLQPLENAWPVQRQASPLKQEEKQAAFSDDEHIKTSENTVVIPEILGQEAHAQVVEVLREVSSAKPTDSSVEVITPRRQRPTREKDPEVELAEKAAPFAHDQAPSKPEHEPSAAAPGIEISAEDFESASDGVLMASQEVAGEAHLMTEIGPLPIDLWELIGESPQSAQPQPMQSASPATSGKPAPRESLAPQNVKKIPEAPAGFVQRQPAEPGTAASTGISGAAGAAESQAEQPQAEIDMDELARRVYGEVKKRLALEWERMRRRL